ARAGVSPSRRRPPGQRRAGDGGPDGARGLSRGRALGRPAAAGGDRAGAGAGPRGGAGGRALRLARSRAHGPAGRSAGPGLREADVRRHAPRRPAGDGALPAHHRAARGAHPLRSPPARGHGRAAAGALRARGDRVKRALTGVAVALAFILCWVGADVRPSALFDPGNVRAVGSFARGLLPPDLSPGFLRVVAEATARTLGISIAGTVLSGILGLALGLLGTASLWRRGPLVDADGAGFGSALSIGAKGLARFLRAVPDLVWALLFVVGFGLGPLPGTLALAVSYAGVLGRVY